MDVVKMVEARKDELFEILSALIQFDSQNFGHYGKEKAVSEYIRDQIEAMGYTADMYSPLDIEGMAEHVDYWPGRGLENRYNVSAVIPGKDHSRRIMLAAHSDTVPIGDPANWTVEPLGGEIRDGKVWGRGACDDKYALASMLLLMRIFRDENITPEYDLVFTAYCDEEYGGSNGALAACLRYPCDECISLDCGDFEVWNLASGGGEFKVHIKSKKLISDCGSMLAGLNVVKEELDAFKERRKAELLRHAECQGTIIPDTAVRLMEIRTGNEGNDLDRGVIKACFYTSQTKEEIFAEFEEMGKALTQKQDPLGIDFVKIEMTTRFFHFGKSEKENPVMDGILRAASVAPDRAVTPVASCLSDLSIFIKYGSPRAFAFGIGRGFDEYGGAHQPDEFIECDKLLDYTKILAEFVTCRV